MTEVVVYTKKFCPYCSLLKNELAKKGISFTAIDLSDDELRNEFYGNVGVTTVPQLFITDQPFTETNPSGRRIGGWTEVSADWSIFDELRD